MRTLLMILITFLAAVECSACKASDSLIVLYDQIVGPSWKTHELRLDKNGDVVEESYDWSSKKYHLKKVIRHLSNHEIEQIALIVTEQVDALPRNIDKERPTSVDAEYKTIRINFKSVDLSSTWDSYANQEKTEENTKFKAAWSFINVALLKGESKE